MLVKRTGIVLIDKDDRLRKPTRRRLVRELPAYKKRIREYWKKHKVTYGSREDMEGLFRYCNQ
jgi:hypothetical protein